MCGDQGNDIIEVTNLSSFDNIQRWTDEIDRYAGEAEEEVDGEDGQERHALRKTEQGAWGLVQIIKIPNFTLNLLRNTKSRGI